MNLKQNIARALALLLGLAMMFSMTACGGDSSNTPAPEPSEVMPADENLPDSSEGAPEMELPAEPTPEPETDLLTLSYDFPNSGVCDDGTKNTAAYIVTLHGGVQVELQKGVETQIIKLDGFGTVSDSSNIVAIPNAQESQSLPEVSFDANLSWNTIVSAVRESLDLRDDVVFEANYDVVYPQDFATVIGMDYEYGNMIQGAAITAYNGTDAEIPIADAPIVSVMFVTMPHDSSHGMDVSPATDVLARFGEPICVSVSWSDSTYTLKDVNYYWKCDGFYVRYTVVGSNGHGTERGGLRCFLDDPAVVEHYFADVAAFMNG